MASESGLTARFLPRIAATQRAAGEGGSFNGNVGDRTARSKYRQDIGQPIQIQLRDRGGNSVLRDIRAMKVGVAVSDDLRKRVAVAKLKRLLEAMDTAMKDLD